MARKKNAWGFVARRGSDSKHVYVSRALAEEIAESPAGTRQDYLALWLVPPFYMDAGEGKWRTEHGGLPIAWEYNLGKQNLPEDYLRDPREWLERVKREEYPHYEKRDVVGTRAWNAKNRAVGDKVVSPSGMEYETVIENASHAKASRIAQKYMDEGVLTEMEMRLGRPGGWRVRVVRRIR